MLIYIPKINDKIKVWVIIINPILNGCLENNITKEIKIIIVKKKNKISKNSLIKIIILEIIDENKFFSLKFLNFTLFLVYKTNVFY